MISPFPLPVALIATLPTAVVSPIIPPILIFPVPERRVKVCVPAPAASIPPSPLNVIEPPSELVFIVVLPVRVVAQESSTLPALPEAIPVVKIVPFVLIVPPVISTRLISAFVLDPS